jgi:DNA repair exonuclease SbcCD ATPase subunit
MQITHINIENIRGIESLEIKPGALTVVSGSNGAGKSSVIAAIQTTFEGGHDASLIRKGAKKGTVELVLSDGTTITRTITPKSSTLDVKTKDGDTKKAPASYVSQLASGIALDPIRLLTAKPKERGAFLLATSNVSFQPAEIAAAIGQDYDINLTIEGMDKLRKSIYEQRTALNIRKKEADATASALRQSLPADMDKDWGSELTAVESELLDRSNELSRIEAEAKQELAKAEHEINEDFRLKVKALEEARDEQIRTLMFEYQNQKDTATRELAAEVAALTGRKSEAKAKAAEQQRAATLKAQVDAQIQRYRELDKESDKLTKAMEKLDALKSAKLAEDGIEGMEIVDGEIYVDGIPFDALNTARRYELAFAIAARGAGTLPLMICDQAEVFDSETWAEFKAAATASGMQIIAARVDDGDLNVEVAA